MADTERLQLENVNMAASISRMIAIKERYQLKDEEVNAINVAIAACYKQIKSSPFVMKNESKYCSSCFSRIRKDQKFCSECGQRIG